MVGRLLLPALAAAHLSAGAGPSLAPGLAAVDVVLGSQTEAECVANLKAADLAGLRDIPFSEVEGLVRRGWWEAAQTLVARSHLARLDFTAPVRRATAELKREADALLKWLDPRFANPETIPMALRWAQNHSAVMLVARFAPKWDAPGANLAVHTTERGRGHLDKERTSARIKELLQVNITARRISADIIAEAGSARKRYRLEAELFDCIVPERSLQEVEFQRAQGSMQMSTGAQIPELVLTLRKRWPGPRPWARLTSATEGEGGLAPPWWADAPGLTEKGTAAMRGHPERGATTPTCSRGGTFFCSVLDACVPSCEECLGAYLPLAGEHRCVGHPRAVTARHATFTDTDLRPASVGGPLSWEHQLGESLDDFADSFSVHWGASETEALGDSFIASVPVYADDQLEVALPNGTEPPPGACCLLVFAVGEVGRSLVLSAHVQDRVRSPPARGLRFKDEDPRPLFVAGTVEIERAEDEAHVEAYRVQWGRRGPDGQVRPLVADHSGAALAEVWTQAGPHSGAVELRIEPASVGGKVRATHLLAYAVGRGGVLSEPSVLELRDAGPPNVPPKSIKAEPDTNPRSRIVTLSIAVAPGSCSSGQAARSRKPSVPDECDIGSAYVVYWVHTSGAKMGEPIVELPPEPYSYQLYDTPIPDGASAVMVVARNEHGEMPTGPSVKIVDNQSDKVAAWAESRVFAAGTDGSLSMWKPADPSSRPSRLETAGRSITALVVDDSHGRHVVLGHDDGSVAVVDARDNVVLTTLTGNGRVTSLAFSGSRMQMVRGVKSGAVEWWDITLGFVVAQLQGHTDAVTGLEAHWDSERLASASRDGTLRLWNLEGSKARTDASQLRPVFAPATYISVGLGASQGAGCFAISWDQERLLAPVDEAMHLFDLQSGERFWTLEGHSEPVRFITMAWDQMRALSVAQDNVVKVWDLRSRECIFTLARSNLEPIRTVHVRWESMQAMAVLYDGTVAVWDFQDDDANFAMVPLGRTVRAAAVL